MDKKIALVHLLEDSVLLTDQEKLQLIELVPSLTIDQIDALGKFLVTEQEFLLENEEEILAHTRETLEKITGKPLSPGENQVLVGKGKA